MKKKIQYLIGKHITGRNTFLFSIYKPNSAGNYKMRDTATIYNIRNLLPLISKVSQYFNKIEAKDYKDIKVDKNLEIKLKNLFNKHGSDKASGHGYEVIYTYVLSQLPKKINLLEIGLGTNNINVISNMGKGGKPGASLFAFSELLPDGKIFGADIDRRILFNKNNIRTFYLDQTNEETYYLMSKEFGDINYDLIIDDGLHLQSANLNTLNFSLNKLNKNGYLVIEDIPEFALDTWYIIGNLIGSSFEFNIVRAAKSFVVLLKKIA
tara:strand:- start:32572 stop:33369 length:798 start_codon:yes stop_codon:yes gene_type:complete